MKNLETLKKELATAMESARETHEYRAAGASMEITEKMVMRMEELDLSRSDLAREAGVSPAYITKILRGDTNFTIDTLVKVAHALRCELRCHLQPEGARSQWFDVMTSKVKESFHASASAPEVIVHGAFRKVDWHKLQEDARETDVA